MLKKAVRLGTLLVLVASFMISPVSAKPAHVLRVGWDVEAFF